MIATATINQIPMIATAIISLVLVSAHNDSHSYNSFLPAFQSENQDLRHMFFLHTEGLQTNPVATHTWYAPHAVSVVGSAL